MSDQPSAATIDKLTQIWQRALQRSPIHPDDNFYEMGGNDASADAIFAEIAQQFGRELPSATVRYAPTITVLSSLLEQPTLPRFSPIVPLRPGSEHPPIFIAPGVGGRASFRKLAKHTAKGHPIYGIQAKGVDGLEKPLERIEEMAAFYLDDLKRVQPCGPYILIGYSFGGLVALEMAQRLSTGGSEVALLVLIDTYPHPRYFPIGQRLWLALKRTQARAIHIGQMTVPRAFAYVGRKVEQMLRVAGLRRSEDIASGPGRLSFARTIPRVQDTDFVAMKNYRPPFYKGKIRFIRPEANSYLPNHPAAIWTRLAAELEVETVPGDHLGMVGKQFETLAAVLTRYVQESVGAKLKQESER